MWWWHHCCHNGSKFSVVIIVDSKRHRKASSLESSYLRPENKKSCTHTFANTVNNAGIEASFCRRQWRTMLTLLSSRLCEFHIRLFDIVLDGSDRGEVTGNAVDTPIPSDSHQIISIYFKFHSHFRSGLKTYSHCRNNSHELLTSSSEQAGHVDASRSSSKCGGNGAVKVFLWRCSNQPRRRSTAVAHELGDDRVLCVGPSKHTQQCSYYAKTRVIAA